jgi:hypothetical protein
MSALSEQESLGTKEAIKTDIGLENKTSLSPSKPRIQNAFFSPITDDMRYLAAPFHPERILRNEMGNKTIVAFPGQICTRKRHPPD